MEIGALASLATLMQAQSLQQAVSTSVMKMEMDSAKQSAQAARSASSFLVSAIAFAGLSPFGQAVAQFMIVWQR